MLRSSLLAAALLLALAACGDGDTSTPTSSTTVAEQSTNTPPPPTSDAARARLVYLKDGDLWTADLNGSDPMRAAAGGSLGFAGVVDRDLFYTLMAPGREFTLFRVRAGASPEELLRFRGSSKNEEFYFSNAAVSPDGGTIAFVDENGLALHDVDARGTRRLLDNVSCDNPAVGTGCWGYFFPAWSPDGRKLSIEKIFFEGSRTAIIDDLTAEEATERVLDYGGVYSTNQWAEDGARICTTQFSYGGGPPIIVDVVSGDGSQVLPEGERSTALFQGCDWSPNGKLAVIYTSRSATPDPPGRLALLTADGQLMPDVLGNMGSRPVTFARWLDDRRLIVQFHDGDVQIVDIDNDRQHIPVHIDRLIDVVFY